MSRLRVLVTGANGFIGKTLVKSFDTSKFEPLLAVRNTTDAGFSQYLIQSLDSKTDFSDALSGVDVVIHLAAIAHVVKSERTVPLDVYREVNVLGTLNLAKQAADAGVKRFVFMSSIGVNGVSNNAPFRVDDKPAPVEDYAVSKLEAELGLRDIAVETGIEIVIIRPPLVYGPSAPGNFGKLARLAMLNLPLPLGAIHNKRSFVAIDNLVDLIIKCSEHPKAANQTFLVCDDENVSTTVLLKMMIEASGNIPMLLPVPQTWLKTLAKLIGKQDVVERFCGDLQVDIEHTKSTLNWHPVISVRDAINKCFSKG